MKMEHLVTAPHGGIITKIAASDGVTLMQGEPILFIEPAEVDGDHTEEETAVDLDHIRADLAEVIARHANTLDASRPASVERRRKTNQRTARENIATAGRCRLVRRIRLAGGRRAAPPPQARRPDQEHARRRPDHRRRHRQRRQGRRPRSALHGDRLRLHGARRHPGPYEPQEDRPHALADRTVAASAGVLCGRRRRPSRRYRPARHDRPRRAVLRAVREDCRALCRWSAWSRAIALPATPRCWAAAT